MAKVWRLQSPCYTFTQTQSCASVEQKIAIFHCTGHWLIQLLYKLWFITKINCKTNMDISLSCVTVHSTSFLTQQTTNHQRFLVLYISKWHRIHGPSRCFTYILPTCQVANTKWQFADESTHQQWSPVAKFLTVKSVSYIQQADRFVISELTSLSVNNLASQRVDLSAS